MMKKEYTYRGKKLEELQKMGMTELAELFPSKQRRTIKRGFSPEQKLLLKKIRANKSNIETHCRDLVILPEMVGKIIKIHNGKDFVLLNIEAEMIGHLLGEFSLTRKRVGHNSPGVGATRSSSNISVK
ncbi:30S ribosomal protein S19 [Candidatus Woesearchaeota archaeon]|nr:30S ribosomal protein S19 [Candidatus Woesearchaeota archaeon]MBL7050607.1 30S ribosomal protein S19 [Candidatus Woesearchaeota archaeon]